MILSIELESIQIEEVVASYPILSLPLHVRNRTNDGTVIRRGYIITYSPVQCLSFSVDGISSGCDDAIALVALFIPDMFCRTDPAISLPKCLLLAVGSLSNRSLVTSRHID